MKNTISLQIKDVTIETQGQAKELILEGLGERFGSINYSLNPDLNHIVASYIEQGDRFFACFYEQEMVCTGALIYESEGVGRIARMSVKLAYRRKGIASQMIERLVETAKQSGLQQLVLETNIEWADAVRFYQMHGFKEYKRDLAQIHMNRKI